ncbi:teichoic acid D-Ala incorporation-associated protein DltX [Mammaliicoccus sp. Dog046]|nr:teichoic acid D-Ala incorporation-associated protein DltX [Mammaliicoccus sp. Dog046]WQK84896.1 teichoic acid D-Ala incorporation-associated protein DltX [Mammaliicoccus sp. Dog046]
MEKFKSIFQTDNAKIVGLTLFYFVIMLILFWIYGGGNASNNFIYNEF